MTEVTFRRSGDLSADSRARTMLARLLADETLGWNIDPNSYVPEIYFRSDKFSILLQQSIIVVNDYGNGGKGLMQVTRELPQGFFAKIQDELADEK